MAAVLHLFVALPYLQADLPGCRPEGGKQAAPLAPGCLRQGVGVCVGRFDGEMLMAMPATTI
jgi:hypothetical protein